MNFDNLLSGTGEIAANRDWSFGHLEPEFGPLLWLLAFSFHAHVVSTRGFIVVPETQPWRMLRTDSDLFKCFQGKLSHEIPRKTLVFHLQTCRKLMEVWCLTLYPFC